MLGTRKDTHNDDLRPSPDVISESEAPQTGKVVTYVENFTLSTKLVEMETRLTSTPTLEVFKDDGPGVDPQSIPGPSTRNVPQGTPTVIRDTLMYAMELNVENFLERFLMLSNKIDENVRGRGTYNPDPLEKITQ